MKKSWLLFVTTTFLIVGCAPKYQPYTGVIQALPGAQVHYEPFHPASLENYQNNGKNHKVIRNPENFMEQGVAGWFDDSLQNKTTLIGEKIDNYEFVGAHSRLPLPSYVTVTNMNNGRQVTIRLIAREPVKDGTIITLSRRTAERLMLTEITPVQIDYITVSADGQMAGSQATHAEEVRFSYPLPERPDIVTQ